MECEPQEKNRTCSQCSYEVKDKEVIRCPRCNKVLLKKCSECDKCSFM